MRTAAKELRRLGARLRALRLARKLSQLTAAELVGLHPTQVYRLEAGRSNVTFLTLVAFARAYRVTLRELLDDDETLETSAAAKRPEAPPPEASRLNETASLN